VVAVNIDLAAADDIGFDVFHVAEEIQHVQAVIAETEALQVLKVNAEGIRRLFFNHIGAPRVIVI
jgi:hypothetical protein